jgi:inorganic pyrophosphatase
MPPPAFDAASCIHVTVESPKGSQVKLKYSTELRAFTVQRELPSGLHYPYDWGYVVGTSGEDGDPVDAMVLHDAATYPGVVIRCKPAGLVVVKERKNGKLIDNSRIIATPCWPTREARSPVSVEIPTLVRRQLESFFLHAVEFADKRVERIAWQGPRAASAFLKRHLA